MEEAIDPTSGSDSKLYLERLAERILAGESIDVEALCREHPTDAELIRAIVTEVGELAKLAEGLDDGEGDVDDTVRTASRAHGSFAPFLAAIRNKQGFARYRIRGEIATGGMGAILRVQDEVLRRPLAMKVILGQGESDPTGKTPSVDDRTLGRFLDEAHVTARLDHPGIVPVHELGVDPHGRVYFTMKLVKGETFADVIDKVHAGDSEWTMTRALNVLLRVAEAMAYAHRKNVLHRDLKPSNIMVGRFGEVYVMDWGLARVLGEPDHRDIRVRKDEPNSALTKVSSLRRETTEETPDTPLVTMDGDVVGTPAYMSPEQADGRIDELGPRSDVYSFGAMLYHLLAGHSPYVLPGKRLSARTIRAMVLDGPPTPIAQLSRKQPAELHAICDRAMVRDIIHRYSNMQELGRDLRAFLEERVVRAYRTGARAEFELWIRRNKTTAITMAASLSLLILISAWFTSDLQSSRDELRHRNTLLLQEKIGRRWSDYVREIHVANTMLSNGDFRHCAGFLAQCPVEHRGWEWHFISTEQSKAMITIPGFTRCPTWSNDGDVLYYCYDGEPDDLDNESSVNSLVISSKETQVLFTESQISFSKMERVGTNLLIIADNYGQDKYEIIVLDLITKATTWRRSIPYKGTRTRDQVPDASMSRDGQTIAILTNPNHLSIFDTHSDLEPLNTQLHLARGTCVSLHPTQPMALIGSNDSSVELINFRDRESVQSRLLTPSVDQRSPVHSIQYSDDGRSAIAGIGDGIELFETADFATSTHSHRIGSLSQDIIVDIADKKQAFASDSKLIIQDETEPGAEAVVLSPNGGHFRAISLNPTHDLIAASSSGKTHVFSTVPSSTFPHLLPLPQYAGARCAAINSSGEALVITGSGTISSGMIEDVRIVFSNLSRDSQWSRTSKHLFFSPSLSSNGLLVAVASIKGVEAIDASTGTTISSRTYNDFDVLSCAADPDGRYIAVLTQSWIEVLDSRTCTPRWRVKYQNDSPFSRDLFISVSRNAELVMAEVGSHNRLVWRPMQSQLALMEYESGLNKKTSVSPDGSRFMTHDSTELSLFSPDRPQCLLRITPPYGISCATWSSDGSSILIANMYGMTVLRTRVEDTVLDSLDARLLRETSLIFDELQTNFQDATEIETRLTNEPRLSGRRRAIAMQLWGNRREEISVDLANEATELCSASDRPSEDYAKALHLAETAMRLCKFREPPYFALGTALYRCGMFERAHAAFLNEIAMNTKEIELESVVTQSLGGFDEPINRLELVYTSRDDGTYRTGELSAWLALTEAKLGIPHQPPKGLEFDKVSLNSIDFASECRIVHEARAVLGMKVNPENLPPLPDDDN